MWLWSLEDRNKTIVVPLSSHDDDLERSLAAMYERAQDRAQHNIRWYVTRKAFVATISRILRFAAILFVIVGGLTPLAKTTFPAAAALSSVDLAQLGYFFLAFAGVCLAADRYIGCSTAWVRYIMIASSIEKEREEFSYGWTKIMGKYRGQNLTDDKLAELVLLCRTFNDKIAQLIQMEIAAWVNELRITNTELHTHSWPQIRSGVDSNERK